MLSPVRPSVRLSQGWISRKRLRLCNFLQFSRQSGVILDLIESQMAQFYGESYGHVTDDVT